MSWLDAQQIANYTDGVLMGENVAINSISTDSRLCKQSELFIALHGERLDAHDFVNQDLSAAAVMVHRLTSDYRPQILVANTSAALTKFASSWRMLANKPLIALTGSNGKTTVRQMLQSILAQKHCVLATTDNLNNHIGVPLTLLCGREEHDYWIIEIGASQVGDISQLARIVKPNIALVNNVAVAHLQGFGSLENVAHAKGEIYRSLDADGVAIINGDDAFADYWSGINEGHRIIIFGFNAHADVQGLWSEKKLTVRIQDCTFSITLSVPGKHNAANALAACAAAHAVGIDIETMQAGLSSFLPAPSRLQHHALGNITLINDTYNANPASFEAAINVLAESDSLSILVMGDMNELGADALELHAAVGACAKNTGIDILMTLGELSHAAVEEFGLGGKSFTDVDSLLQELEDQYLEKKMTILVKGSRSMRMERVVDGLLHRYSDSRSEHAA